MSSRKPTIDDLDDLDDEDGTSMEEGARPSELSLPVRSADDVGLGGAPGAGRDEDPAAER